VRDRHSFGVTAVKHHSPHQLTLPRASAAIAMSNQEALNAATKLIHDQAGAALSDLNDQAEAATQAKRMIKELKKCPTLELFVQKQFIQFDGVIHHSNPGTCMVCNYEFTTGPRMGAHIKAHIKRNGGEEDFLDGEMCHQSTPMTSKKYGKVDRKAKRVAAKEMLHCEFCEQTKMWHKADYSRHIKTCESRDGKLLFKKGKGSHANLPEEAGWLEKRQSGKGKKRKTTAADSTYKCQICTRVYATQSDLNRHKKDKHK
jgi:hypothetical protein